ncbi:hypothetical protein Tco_0851116 [Tanacetum coccineum]
MVLEDQTGWKLRRKQWTGTTEQLIEDLESAYGFDFNFQIMHPICFRFEYIMVENFEAIQAECKYEPLFYNYLRPLTSLDEGLYALACEEDVRCMATLVRSFKLIEVYIEHGVTTLDCYIRPPRFRATIEDITDKPGSIAANGTEKMLLLTWHESSELIKEPVCDSVIDDVIRQLSFEEIEFDGEACFVDVVGSGVESSRLSHDESFGVDDLDLNLYKPVNLNVSQIETQFELSMPEELDVSRTHEPIVAEVSNQEPIVAEVSTQVPIIEEGGTQEFTMKDVVLKDYVSFGEDVEHGNGQEDEAAPSDGQFFYDDEGIDIAYETEYDVQSSEDSGTYDDDDKEEDFLVDEEKEIVEPDVDVHLFGISMDLPFDNIGVTNLVPDDVLKGEGVDVINADSFDSNPGNDDETNDYRRRRLAELSREMKGVINASGQWKYTFCTGQKFTTPKEAKDRIFDQVRVNPDILVKAVQDQFQRDLEVQISMSKAFRAKAKAKREIRGDHVERNTNPSLPTRVFQRIYVCLGALKLGFRARGRDLLGLDGVFMKGPFPGQVLAVVRIDSNNGIYPLAYALVEAKSKSSRCWFLQCLGDDIDLHPNSNFTFISNRQKCGQAYKDFLWRAASATSVKEFEKRMLDPKMMNPKGHEWLNKIPPEH